MESETPISQSPTPNDSENTTPVETLESFKQNPKKYLGKSFRIFSIITIVITSLIFGGLFIAGALAIADMPSRDITNVYELAGFITFLALIPLALTDLILFLVAKRKAKKSGTKLSKKVTEMGKTALVFNGLMFFVGLSAAIPIIKNSLEPSQPITSHSQGTIPTYTIEERYDIKYIIDPDATIYKNPFQVSCYKYQGTNTILHNGIVIGDILNCPINLALQTDSDTLHFTKLQMNYSTQGLQIDKIYADKYGFDSDNFDFQSDNNSFSLTDKKPSNQGNVKHSTPVYIEATVTDPSNLSLTFTNIYTDLNGGFITPKTKDSTATFTLYPTDSVQANFSDSAPASLYGYKIINGEWGQDNIYVNDKKDNVILGLYKLTDNQYQKINQIQFNDRLMAPNFDFNAGTITYNFTSESGDCYRKILNFESLEETETTDACRTISQ